MTDNKSLYASRIAICRACDRRRELPAGLLQCMECGCIMTMKAHIPRSKCPLAKW